jgi:hypothetical protein
MFSCFKHSSAIIVIRAAVGSTVSCNVVRLYIVHVSVFYGLTLQYVEMHSEHGGTIIEAKCTQRKDIKSKFDKETF